MKKYAAIIEFSLLTYLITWGIWLPFVLKNLGIISADIPQVLFVFGMFGPVISAIIISRRHEGRGSIKNLFKKMLIVRVGTGWLIFTLILPFVIVLLVLCGLVLIYGPIPGLEFAGSESMIGIFFYSLIPCANEELSWRGFVLPGLQKHNTALTSSIIIGILWGFLHFPLFIIQPDRSGGFSLLYIVPLFLLMTTFLSIIYTTLYNNTGGSIFIATLFHTIFNTANELYSAPGQEYDLTALILFLGITFFAAAIIIILFGSKDLSKKPRLTNGLNTQEKNFT